MAIIEARGLSKRFRNGALGLDGVDVEVRSGETVALLGRNGAGKSTLLRILATVVLPDGGHARVAGHDIKSDAVAVRRSIGVVLGEDRSWYMRLSGQANLEFFAAVQGLGRRDARRRVATLLDDMGLFEAAGRSVNGYSAGMRARLALARATLMSPPVLLLDEPTRSLDPVAAAEFRHHLELLRQHQVATLLATHDLHEAASSADRLLVLAKGSVRAQRAGGSSAAEIEGDLLGLAGP